MIPLDTLSPKDASALEQICLRAQIQLNNERDELVDRLEKRTDLPSAASISAQIETVNHYARTASRFYIAAQRRRFQAEREQCAAIRVIQAFAMCALPRKQEREAA